MRKLVALVLVFAVIAAACGDDDVDSGSAEPTTGADGGDPTPGDGDEPSAFSVIAEPSAGTERAAPDPDAPISELAVGFNDAGFELWRTQPAGENFVFSPMSVGHALLMARAAADDTTGAAIDATLQLPEGVSAHEAWNAVDLAMADAAAAEDELTINVADAIFPRLDVDPAQEWVDLLTAQHGASVEKLDFAGDPDASTDRINSWISDQTEGLIPDLLPEGFVEPNTVLVLADAVYFKAQWQLIFGKYGPVTGDFTLLDGTTVPIEFMQELELQSNRGQGEGFVAAELPYVGGEFSMLVVVPDEGRFAEFRDGLDTDRVAEIDATLTPGPFELWLPKWETTSTVDLLDWLTAIGAAPGSYPDITEGAFLDAAIHGADIAVDEWGTVAAAATAFGFDESAGEPADLKIKADQPFLYLIRHQPSGLILFAGQVTDPN